MRSLLMLITLALTLRPGVVQADEVERLAAETVDRILANIDGKRVRPDRRFDEVRVPQLKPLPADTIDRIVADHANDVRTCYLRHAAKQKTASGRLRLVIEIAWHGRVTGLKVEAPGVRGRGLTRCLRQQVRDWRFPRSDKDTTVYFPFLFLKTHSPGAGPTKK
jgi:hypothetical protein